MTRHEKMGLRICAHSEDSDPVVQLLKLGRVFILLSCNMTSIQRRISVNATSGRCINVDATLHKRPMHVGFDVRIGQDP